MVLIVRIFENQIGLSPIASDAVYVNPGGDVGPIQITLYTED